MRRLVLIVLTATLFVARPAWPQETQTASVRSGSPAASPLGSHASGVRAARDVGQAGAAAPVLFVPVQLDAHGTGTGTDNYGRPLQSPPIK